MLNAARHLQGLGDSIKIGTRLERAVAYRSFPKKLVALEPGARSTSGRLVRIGRSSKPAHLGSRLRGGLAKAIGLKTLC